MHRCDHWTSTSPVATLSSMSEQLGFNPEDKQENESQPSRFEEVNSLKELLQVLLEMQSRGEELGGSEQSYSPEDLGRRIMNVVRSANDMVRTYDDSFMRMGSDALLRLGPEAPTVNNLPELLAITRTEHLRDVVARIVQDMVEAPRTLKPYGSGLSIDGDAMESFYELEGLERQQ